VIIYIISPFRLRKRNKQLTCIDANQYDYIKIPESPTSAVTSDQGQYLPVQQPQPRIIGDEADSHAVIEQTSAHCIAQDRIDVVVCATASTSDDSEFVLEIMY
jgi:hypothetical protein